MTAAVLEPHSSEGCRMQMTRASTKKMYSNFVLNIKSFVTVHVQYSNVQPVIGNLQ